MNESNWFEWIAGAAMTLFGWVGKSLHDRVSDVEKSRATNAAVEKLGETMREDISQLRSTIEHGFREQNRQMIDMMRDKR